MNTSITINVRKISNGYLVSTSGMTLNGPGGDESYFATEGEMTEALPALTTGALERAEAEMREIDDQHRWALAQQQRAANHSSGLAGASDIQRRRY